MSWHKTINEAQQADFGVDIPWDCAASVYAVVVHAQSALQRSCGLTVNAPAAGTEGVVGVRLQAWPTFSVVSVQYHVTHCEATSS